MKKLPKSIRKYIRKEKARIRREILGKAQGEEALQKLLQPFTLNITHGKE